MNFLKNLQTDFGQEETSSAETKSSSFILSGGSTLFGSVKSKTENLVNDFSTKVDIGSKLESIKRKASIDQFGQAVKDLVDSNLGDGSDGDDDSTNAPSELNIEPDPKRFPLAEEDTRTAQAHENPFNTQVSRENSLKERPKRPPPPRSVSVDAQAPLLPQAGQRSNSIDVTAIKRKAPPPPPVPLAIPGLPALVAEKIPEEVEVENDEEASIVKPNVTSSCSSSSASEYGGNDGDIPCYEQKPEDQTTRNEEIGQRCVDGIMTDDPDAENILEFMNSYVPAVVNGVDEHVQENKETFVKYIQSAFARSLFVKYVDNEANQHGGQLGQIGQDQLLSHVKLILDECQKSEDFAPAKKLLTVSLIYYHDRIDADGNTDRVFLFSLIKTESIWHTLKFWNACFFQSVQEVRAKILEQDQTPEEIEKAVVKQLRSYLNTMYVFSLHQNIRLEFLRKQSELFNLSSAEMLPLRQMILDKP